MLLTLHTAVKGYWMTVYTALYSRVPSSHLHALQLCGEGSLAPSFPRAVARASQAAQFKRASAAPGIKAATVRGTDRNTSAEHFL